MRKKNKMRKMDRLELREARFKMFWFLVFGSFFFLESCGSRKVASAKQETRLENQEMRSEKQEEEKVVFKVVRDTVYLEKKTEVKSEKQETRQKQTTQKRREYYENGALKSEEEKNITEMEQITQLREELKREKAKSESLKQENESLLKKSENFQSKITELEEKTKEKQTDRKDSWWLYVVIGLSSIAGWEALKRLFLKLKNYVVYFR